MANDIRDPKFEKALASRLRSSEVKDSFAQNAACPDPEILAAYHERSLSLAESTSWKNHIAGCARCQEILAQLEITDGLPVAAGTEKFEKESIVNADGVDFPGANRELTMAAAPAQIRTAEHRPQLERAPVLTLHPPKKHWRWIAPAGAIAAGLLVWVAIHEKSFAPRQSPQAEIALSREPIPAPTPTPRAESLAQPSPEPSEAKKKDSSPRNQLSSKSANAAGRFSSPPPKPTVHAAAAPPPEPPMLTADATSLAGYFGRGSIADLQTKSSGAPGPPLQANKPLGANGALAGVAPAQRVRRPAPSTDAAPAPEAVAKSRQPDDKTVVAQSETVEVTSPAPLPSRKVSAASSYQDLRRISAPDGHTVWMVGPSGLVQHSDDAGKSWKLQESGVTSDLRAGSAPNQKICWVVGSAGIVLRTTDGGKTWTRLSSPIDGDLGGVNASDALHASVTDAANKTSFATADGGMTWTPVPGE